MVATLTDDRSACQLDAGPAGSPNYFSFGVLQRSRRPGPLPTQKRSFGRRGAGFNNRVVPKAGQRLEPMEEFFLAGGATGDHAARFRAFQYPEPVGGVGTVIRRDNLHTLEIIPSNPLYGTV